MKYITDLIGDEYLNWTNQHVLISSPTGSGKTTFILKKLLPRAIEQGKYILYLCNRKILNEQFKEDSSVAFQAIFSEIDEEEVTQEQRNHIIVNTYQSLEKGGISPKGVYNPPNLSIYTEMEIQKMKSKHILPKSELVKWESILYFVYDEAHYFLADSSFNKNCNIWFYQISQNPINWPNQPQGTHIYLTATPELFKVFMAAHYIKDDNFKKVNRCFAFYEYARNLQEKSKEPKFLFEAFKKDPKALELFHQKMKEYNSQNPNPEAVEYLNKASTLMMQEKEQILLFSTQKRYEYIFDIISGYEQLHGQLYGHLHKLQENLKINLNNLVQELLNTCNEYENNISYIIKKDGQQQAFYIDKSLSKKLYNISSMCYQCFCLYYNVYRLEENDSYRTNNLYNDCLSWCRWYRNHDHDDVISTDIDLFKKLKNSCWDYAYFYQNKYQIEFDTTWQKIIEVEFWLDYDFYFSSLDKENVYSMLKNAESIDSNLDIIHDMLKIYNQDLYQDAIENFQNLIERNIKESLEIDLKEYYFGDQFPYQNMETTYFRQIEDLYLVISEEINRTKKSHSLEKWIIFVNDETEGINLSNKLKSNDIEAVIMTSSNIRQKYSDSKKEMETIITQKKFNCDVLIATSVIDCGVSIHDQSVKNIVISHSNKSTFLQMLGRKRLEDNEKIHLYIRMFSRQAINGICHDCEEKFHFMVEYTYYNNPLPPSPRLYENISTTYSARNMKFLTNIYPENNSIRKRLLERADQMNYHYLLCAYEGDKKNEKGAIRPLYLDVGDSSFIYYLYLIYQYRKALNSSTDDLFYLKEQLSWLGQTYSEQNWLNYEDIRHQIKRTFSQYVDNISEKNIRIIKSTNIKIEKDDHAVSVKDFIDSLSNIFQQDQQNTPSLKKFFLKVKKGEIPTISTLNQLLTEMKIPYELQSKQTTFHHKNISVWQIINK